MKLTEAQQAHLMSLETEGRRLTPALVVEDAKQKKSPLHDLFEWNTAAAAYQHWLDTAREIIGSVRVVVTTREYSVKAPGYVRDLDADGQGYQHTSALKRDPATARESLIYTLEVAAGHLRRAYDLSLALGLEAEIDALLTQVAGVQRSIRQAA
jgi:hypothetical protein